MNEHKGPTRMKSMKYALSQLCHCCRFGCRDGGRQTFYHTITGEDLKVPDSTKPEGRDTEGVKLFLETGVNPYNEVKACLHEASRPIWRLAPGAMGTLQKARLVPPERCLLDLPEEQDGQGIVRDDLRRRARHDGPA